MPYPLHRYRRLRKSARMRDMVRETVLQPSDFIYPLFVTGGEKVENPVEAMPGVYQLSVDRVREEAEKALSLGVPSVLLFGIPSYKDKKGSSAYDPNEPVQEAVKVLKESYPELVVITDVCLCEYTSHGHCGVVEQGKVLNDPTLEILIETALSHARAGADIVAPSDMMDGRVQAIREGLDKKGYSEVAILSYAAKYSSSFYGPFREAAGSSPEFGDRKTYQMDPANAREALKEVVSDVEEGADMVMVKPALSYLDVIRRVNEEVNVPVAAYNVSGEYSMIKAASQNGWLEEKPAVLEMLASIKRAGADLILTYYALQAARWLKE